MKQLLLVPVLLAGLMFASCNQQETEEKDIDSSYILITNDTIPNKNELSSLKKRVETLNSQNPNAFQNSQKGNAGKTEKADLVSLKKEVSNLFDPENHPCSLPAKIAKKLKESKEKGNPWAPKFVVEHIGNMPDTVLYMPGKSISNILHWVTVKKNGSTNQFQWLITGAPTYNNFDVEGFILGGVNSFFYNLDCSGYLNAAIEGSGAVPGADITASAKSAMEKQSAMFIGGGTIISPLSAAYYGSLVTMDKATRLKILQALVAIPNTSDKDVIEMNVAYDAIWASKDGSSSFNGKADLGGNVRGGIGVAQFSSSSNGGGAISRKSSFSNFNTYLSRERPLPNPEVITIAKIKAKIKSL